MDGIRPWASHPGLLALSGDRHSDFPCLRHCNHLYSWGSRAARERDGETNTTGRTFKDALSPTSLQARAAHKFHMVPQWTLAERPSLLWLLWRVCTEASGLRTVSLRTSRMPVDWWILLPGQNHVDSSGSGQQPYAKQLGFPTLIEVASDCASLSGYFFPKGPGEICPVHLPANHENHGSFPKTAECQDWKGLGNFLIHPSSCFIYRNPDSERATAYNWMVTKLEPLRSSPVSQISNGSAQLYHPDSHSFPRSPTFSTGMANTWHAFHQSAVLCLKQTSLINHPPFFQLRLDVAS